MATGLGGGGLPRIKELLAYLKALNDTVFTTGGATKAARVNLRDALGNELGTAAGTALKVDVSGDFPDNIQGAVENGVADIDPNLPGHRVKPVKIGSRANAAAPTAVAENQITDAWFDLYGRMNVAMSDGSLVTLGAIADAVVAAGATGSVSAKLRRISNDLDAMHTTLKTINSVIPVVNNNTGVGAIAVSFGPAYHFYLHAIILHFDSAPTTAGDLVITIHPIEGAAYNTTLVLFDPSASSITDMVYQPNIPLLCKNGDTISIAYANPDGKTYGIRSVVIAA